MRIRILFALVVTSLMSVGITVVFVAPFSEPTTGFRGRFTPATVPFDFYEVTCQVFPIEPLPSAVGAQGQLLPAGYVYQAGVVVNAIKNGEVVQTDQGFAPSGLVIRYTSACNTDVDGDGETTNTDFNEFFLNFAEAFLCDPPFVPVIPPE